MIETAQKTQVRLAPALLICLGAGLVAAFTFFATGTFQVPSAHPLVDDRTAAVMLTRRTVDSFRRYEKTPQRQKSARQRELTNFLRQRKQRLLQLMESDPASLSAVALPKGIREALPVDLQQFVEQPVSTGGTLTIVHFHDSQGSTVRTDVLLQTAEKSTFHLFFPTTPDLASDTQVTLTGTALDANIIVDEVILTEEAVAQTPPAVASVGQKKIAVILFNFLDDTSQPITPTDARGQVFTNPVDPSTPANNSTDTWYQEVSNNQVDLVGQTLNQDGDVFGWITIPVNKSAGCGYFGLGAWQAYALPMAGVNEDDYDAIVLRFPTVPSCGADAWAYGKLAFINSNITTLSFRHQAHELGHVFGVGHAAFYKCFDAAGNKVPISQNCTIQEYYDPFDVMGGSYNGGQTFTYHFHNAHKDKLGYIPGTNVATVTTNGTYTINRQQTTEAGTRVLKIPRAYVDPATVKDYYYPEYRPWYGIFDQFNYLPTTIDPSDGVSVRIAPVTPRFLKFEDSYLIDTSSATHQGRSALTPGQTFTDPYAGITLSGVTLSPTSTPPNATVDVSFFCARNTPAFGVNPATWAQYGRPGDSLTFPLDIRNNDSPPCGPTTFTVQPTLPGTDWSQSPLSITLAPQESASINAVITSPATATDGTYSITETLLSPNHTPINSYTPVYYRIDVTPPTLTIETPASGATLPATGTQTFKASGTDANFLWSIALFIDEVQAKECTSVTITIHDCSYDWNLSTASLGPHRLKAVAQDNTPMRNSTTREIDVTVAGRPRPSPPVEVSP